MNSRRRAARSQLGRKMAQKPFSGLQLELFHFGGVFGSDANHVFVQRDEGVQRTKKQQKNRKQASECRSTFSIPTFLTQTATVETYVSAVCRNRTYIPFNPTNGDANNENHIAKQRSEKTKEIFYSWPSIDPSLMHTLPSGESLPLYRWKYRHWLFHRFDEGIQFHVNGFMEVTPEDVARHIARSMRRFVAVNPLFKNQQLKSNPSEQEMPASSAQALDARKEGTAKSLDSGCRDSSGSLNSDLRNGIIFNAYTLIYSSYDKHNLLYLLSCFNRLYNCLESNENSSAGNQLFLCGAENG